MIKAAVLVPAPTPNKQLTSRIEHRQSYLQLPYQTVAAMYLERRVEPVFHPDSYGYRPRRSALDAVEQCRRRCWRSDWVVDLDIRAFFDSVDHELMLRAVERHIDADGKWVLLYVRRWLVAPLARADGSVQQRDRGTPQGQGPLRDHVSSGVSCWPVLGGDIPVRAGADAVQARSQ